MSVASIDYAIDERVAEQSDRSVVDDAAWPDCRASLRRPFTRYQPRHRADGVPACGDSLVRSAR